MDFNGKEAETKQMRFAVDRIKPNPFRNITHYPIDPEKVAVLAASIQDTAFWNNILARLNKDGEPEIAYGHHRLEAIKQAGYKEVTLNVAELSDEQMLKIMANENLDEWKTNMDVIRETVRAVKAELERQLRDEASVFYKYKIDKLNKPHVQSRWKDRISADDVAWFLGGPWKETYERVLINGALHQLAAIEAGMVTEEQMQVLTKCGTRDKFDQLLELARLNVPYTALGPHPRTNFLPFKGDGFPELSGAGGWAMSLDTAWESMTQEQRERTRAIIARAIKELNKPQNMYSHTKDTEKLLRGLLTKYGLDLPPTDGHVYRKTDHGKGRMLVFFFYDIHDPEFKQLYFVLDKLELKKRKKSEKAKLTEKKMLEVANKLWNRPESDVFKTPEMDTEKLVLLLKDPLVNKRLEKITAMLEAKRAKQKAKKEKERKFFEASPRTPDGLRNARMVAKVRKEIAEGQHVYDRLETPAEVMAKAKKFAKMKNPPPGVLTMTGPPPGVEPMPFTFQSQLETKAKQKAIARFHHLPQSRKVKPQPKQRKPKKEQLRRPASA